MVHSLPIACNYTNIATDSTYLNTIFGEPGLEIGVTGKIIEGDPSLDLSKDRECDRGGV